MIRLRSLVLLPLTFFVAASVNACGDDAASNGGTPNVAGGGGAAGSTSGGAAGKATGGTSAGGSSNGGANAGGTSAGGTSAGGTNAGGTSAGGTSAGGCTKDAECAGSLVPTKPEGCAEAYCNAGKCALRAKDADGDGFRIGKCQAISDKPVEVEVGKDCDDTKKDVNPAAWDGPAGEGHPDACNDGVDQNCSGADGDDQLANGASCACQPGDVSECSETAGGAPIVFPGGSPAPGSACRRGKKTCENDPVQGGKFGPCIGAVGVQLETCNSIDDDCDGKTDEEDALDQVEWVYDGDGDNQGAMLETPGSSPPVRVPFATLKACSKPNVVPVECTAAYCGAKPIEECCPKDGWRAGLPKTDCDDRNTSVFLGSLEKCGNQLDDDCDGVQDEQGAVGEVDWVYDGDADGFASLAIGIKRSCAPPPCDAATGPNCAGKWKVGLPLTDCDDTKGNVRPGVLEDCASPDDDNCNGSTKDSCSCTPGVDPPIDCGLPGECNYVAKGSTCGADGKYTSCDPVIPKVEFCPDVDSDGFCLTSPGSCGLFCATGKNTEPSVKAPTGYIVRTACQNSLSGVTDCNDGSNAVKPSAPELCGDALDSNCTGGDSDGYDVGSACNVPVGDVQGACIGGGTVGCSSPGSTTVKCNKREADIGTAVKKRVAAKHNGSYDWNCDGEVTVSHTPCTSFTLTKGGTMGPCTCGTPVTFKLGDAVTNTAQWTTTNLYQQPSKTTVDIKCANITTSQGCASGLTRYFVSVEDCDYDKPRYGCAKGACSGTLEPLKCNWTGSACVAASGTLVSCKPNDKTEITFCN